MNHDGGLPSATSSARAFPPACVALLALLALGAAVCVAAASELQWILAPPARVEPMRDPLTVASWAVAFACLLALPPAWGRARRGETREARAALATLPVTLLAAAVLGATWLRTFDASLASVAAVPVFAALVVGATWGPRIAAALPSWLRRWAPRACASVLVTLVLLELGLRALAVVSPSPLFQRHDLTAQALIEQFRPPSGSVFAGFPRNRRGHFDEELERKRPGRKLAVTIGDSFSQGMVPHGFHFTTVAEALAEGWDVANVGIAGIGPREYHALLVTEGLPLEPDVVVIDLFVGNDVEEAGRILERGALASWLDPDALSLRLVPERLLKVRRSPMAAPFGDGADGGGARSLSRSSTAESLEKYPFLLNPTIEPPSFSEEVFLAIETKRARELCSEGAVPFEPLWKTLLAMRAAAGAARFAVMLIPDEFQVEDAVWEAVSRSLAGQPLDRDRPQRRIAEWAASQGIPCLDVLPALRALAPLPDGRRHAYHLRDTHWNARGNAVAGGELAAFLASLAGAPSSGPR